MNILTETETAPFAPLLRVENQFSLFSPELMGMKMEEKGEQMSEDVWVKGSSSLDGNHHNRPQSLGCVSITWECSSKMQVPRGVE